MIWDELIVFYLSMICMSTELSMFFMHSYKKLGKRLFCVSFEGKMNMRKTERKRVVGKAENILKGVGFR